MKPSTFVSCGAVAMVILAGLGSSLPRAEAYPPFLTAWQNRYPTSTIPQRMQAAFGSACYTCHLPPSVSAPGTCYRLQLSELINASWEVEDAIELLHYIDSDGDGVPNGVEILTARPEGGVGYHPGLIGPTGASPCGPNPTAGVTNTLETPPGYCYPNCDESTIAPILNVADFTCFLQKFAAGDGYANCDGSTIAPVLNVADFTCFLQKFSAGCP